MAGFNPITEDILLLRELHRLIDEGVVERVTNIREISPDQRDKT